VGRGDSCALRPTALHRIGEDQSIGAIGFRFIEAPDDEGQRIDDGVDIEAPLHLEMDVLEARPRALPRGADRPDALAAPDVVAHPNGDLGEMAVDGAEAEWIVVDHDDETAQVAVVTRDGHSAVRGR
jgi:hypothetical protein